MGTREDVASESGDEGVASESGEEVVDDGCSMRMELQPDSLASSQEDSPEEDNLAE